MSIATLRRNAAFTLVELAIVLVVIGLLVGSVVAGRSFIKSAELSSVMTEALAYRAAFGQFQARYQAVPGDYYRATANWNTGDGDGNGFIRAGTNNASEMFLAFQHLSLAGLTEGSFITPTTTITPGEHAPLTPFKGVTYVFNHPNALDGNLFNDSFYFDGTYHHVLQIAGARPNVMPFPEEPFLTAKQAFSLDTKFDDSLPGQGMLVAPKAGALSNCASTDDVITASYMTGGAGISCFLILKLQ